MFKIINLDFIAYCVADVANGAKLPQVISPLDAGIRIAKAPPFSLDDSKIAILRKYIYSLEIDEDENNEPDKSSAHFFTDVALKSITRDAEIALSFDYVNYIKVGGAHVMNMSASKLNTVNFPVSRLYGTTTYGYAGILWVSIRLERKT